MKREKEKNFKLKAFFRREKMLKEKKKRVWGGSRREKIKNLNLDISCRLVARGNIFYDVSYFMSLFLLSKRIANYQS